MSNRSKRGERSEKSVASWLESIRPATTVQHVMSQSSPLPARTVMDFRREMSRLHPPMQRFHQDARQFDAAEMINYILERVKEEYKNAEQSAQQVPDGPFKGGIGWAVQEETRCHHRGCLQQPHITRGASSVISLKAPETIFHVRQTTTKDNKMHCDNLKHDYSAQRGQRCFITTTSQQLPNVLMLQIIVPTLDMDRCINTIIPLTLTLAVNSPSQQLATYPWSTPHDVSVLLPSTTRWVLYGISYRSGTDDAGHFIIAVNVASETADTPQWMQIDDDKVTDTTLTTGPFVTDSSFRAMTCVYRRCTVVHTMHAAPCLHAGYSNAANITHDNQNEAANKVRTIHWTTFLKERAARKEEAARKSELQKQARAEEAARRSNMQEQQEMARAYGFF
jgi:hypothetical protein